MVKVIKGRLKRIVCNLSRLIKILFRTYLTKKQSSQELSLDKILRQDVTFPWHYKVERLSLSLNLTSDLEVITNTFIKFILTKHRFEISFAQLFLNFIMNGIVWTCFSIDKPHLHDKLFYTIIITIITFFMCSLHVNYYFVYFVILNNNSIVEQHFQLNVILTNQMGTFILELIILNFYWWMKLALLFWMNCF